MAIFTRSPSPGTPSAPRRSPAVLVSYAFLGSGLPLMAILGREHQIAQERLVVDPQHVRVVALDVRADEIPVRRQLHQLAEGACIPAPGQLELEECAVVSLELGSDETIRHGLGSRAAHSSV